MQVPTVVLALSLAAAGVAGCSRSETDVAPTTTTAPRTATTTTTTTLMPADVPESATAPGEVFPRRRQRFGGERPPREPRMPRQAIRNHLAEVLAARRPDRPLSPGEIEQLTNRAMQIRILRSRLAHLRPEAQQTPRAAAMRGRLDALIDDFQTRAGVLITDVPAIFEPPAPRPRRGM
jgi:hypothetical protein